MLNQVCAHCKVAFAAWTQSLALRQEVDPVGWARPHDFLKYLSKHPHTTLHFNLYWKTVICIPCGTLQEEARLPSCVQKQGSSLVCAQRTLQDAKRTLARWLQLLYRHRVCRLWFTVGNCVSNNLKKTQFTLILLVVLVVVGVVGSWLFLLGCFGIHNIYIRLSPKIMSHQCHVDELSMSRTVAHL